MLQFFPFTIGTDGTIFPPFQDIDQSYFIFAPQICRSLRATYDRKSKYKGIQTKRFLVDLDISNSEFNSSCYCRDDGFCPPKGNYVGVFLVECFEFLTNFFLAGMHDMFACVGAPFGLSAAHFYNGIIRNVSLFNKYVAG